ncbi:unnamed protein product [Didymodactylos carnosus]|uniref:Uncharacterized protein n=1 Tax=Didymodactylos carnosus TaxID=1234261 RepID=A0A8S2DKB8_9BILA|nr:unnamed protein product [Didymodactylos carnosus]CAF3705937.1 unnamed protein product [Didymodactylos carnosus]
MDLYTPDPAGAKELNDYLVQIIIYHDHVEGYNKRLDSNFPVHSHIYEYVRLLRDEHVFQHHQAAASEIRAPKRKKLYSNIDNELKKLLHGFVAE